MKFLFTVITHSLPCLMVIVFAARIVGGNGSESERLAALARLGGSLVVLNAIWALVALRRDYGGPRLLAQSAFLSAWAIGAPLVTVLAACDKWGQADYVCAWMYLFGALVHKAQAERAIGPGSELVRYTAFYGAAILLGAACYHLAAGLFSTMDA